jgi:CheY-like chemotaxis protein
MPDRLSVHTTSHPSNSTELPLYGVTVLAVEDSRLACDGLRLMCRKLGARLRRADSLQAADLHLRVYRPDVVLVDLGLPDGRGEALICALRNLAPRPVVLGMSGDGLGRARAMEAGADGYLDKPVNRLALLQDMLLAFLPGRTAPAVGVAEMVVAPDPLALRDDLAYAARLLQADPDPDLRHYLAGFLGGVAQQAQDQPLACAAILAQPKGLRAALNARLALPDQAFAQQGARLDG